MGEAAEKLEEKPELKAVPDQPEKGPGFFAKLFGGGKKKETSWPETQQEIVKFCTRFSQLISDIKSNAGRGEAYKAQTLAQLKELKREAFFVNPKFNEQYLDYLIKSLEK